MDGDRVTYVVDGQTKTVPVGNAAKAEALWQRRGQSFQVVSAPVDPAEGDAGRVPAFADYQAPEAAPEPTPSPAEPDEPPSVWESLVRGARDTASMSWDDEAGGFGAWLHSLGEDDLQGKRTTERGTGAPLSDQTTYEVERDLQRQRTREAEEAHPTAFTVGQGVGVVGTAAAPLGPAAKGASWGARAVKAAPAAGAWGFMSGLGATEEETSSGQFFDGLAGGEGAAVVGPVLGEAAHQLVAKATPWLRRLLTRGKGAKLDAKVLDEIRRQHGDEGVELARVFTSDTPEGAEMRRLVTQAESPERLDELGADTAKDVTDLLRKGSEIQGEETIGRKIRLTKRYLQRDQFLADNRHVLQAFAERVESGDPDAIAVGLRALEERHSPEVAELGRQMIEEGRQGELLRQAVRQVRPQQVDPQAVAGRIDQLVQEERQAVQEMLRKVAPGTREHTMLKKVDKEFLEYDLQTPPVYGPQRPGEQVDWGEVAASKWGRLDAVKREVQRVLDGQKHNSIEREALQGMEDRLRQALEDPSLAGPGAAANQVQRNRAYTVDIPEWKVREQSPARTFLTDATAERAADDPYRSQLVADAGKIRRLYEGGVPEGARPEYIETDPLTKLGRVLSTRADLGDALTDHVARDPHFRTLARDQRQAAGRVAGRIDERRAEAGAAARVNKMEEGLDPDNYSGGPSRVWATLTNLTPYGPQGRAALRAMTGKSGEPRLPGQVGRNIGRLEAQAGAGNELAGEAVDVALRRGRAPVRAAGFTGARIGAEATKDDSMGHETEANVEAALEAGKVPEPYASRLMQARHDGRLAAELYKLNGDDVWRTQVAPLLNEAGR